MGVIKNDSIWICHRKLANVHSKRVFDSKNNQFADVKLGNSGYGSPQTIFFEKYVLKNKNWDTWKFQWNPILDVFDEVEVRFGLEVHPTEIAFDIVTAERALDALGNRPAFGFNYDPSHLAYQGVDCVDFILRF